MTRWQTRKTIGDRLEHRVADLLTARGWVTCPWGQSTLDEAVTQILRRTDTTLRWTPDLLAARCDNTVVMIDCKASMTSRTSHRHAIQRQAVKAHLQFAALFDLPLYYVFDNLGVLTPMDVRGAGQRGPHTRVGSGSPYYLITKELDRPFDTVFGAVPADLTGAA